ncbi:ead/Ea22-like family protein [Citrobacter cronae]|nr:ead/Ea22-like family protein [Citrobacter cronae]MBJ8396856.1 ead/Ea22-like family protein [Citrobacter cronae]MBJ8410983.1 ead/Ea22-like family protein [Citrobacter cronae]
MTALNKQAHQTENERMAQSLAERNGEPVEGLRQRISELEEIATDYGMKFQKAQDALKHQSLLHKSQMEAAEKRIEEEICRSNREHHRGFMMACNHLKEHANIHYADAAEMEIAALRQRINQLEARTVTMPPKEHDNGTDSQIDINAGFANRMWQKCADAIRAAGIGVKGE